MSGYMAQLLYAFYLLSVYILLKAVKHSVERNLGRVGYKREYGVLGVIVHGLQNGVYELLAQLFALAIYVSV